MAMNYKEVPKRLPSTEQAKYAQGIAIMNATAKALLAQGLLPNRFSSMPTPGLSTARPSIEVARQPLSPETQRLVEHLGKSGYAVYDLAGKTPATLRTEGMPFWYVNPALENATALPALVAFKQKPSDFFLKGSESISFEKQLELLPEEQAKVEREYPGAGLIVRVGKPSEWSETAFEHFKETKGKVRIFGKDYGHNYTWADAYESESTGAYRAFVGSWHETYGLVVDFNPPDSVNSRLRLAPLVEIPRQ